MWKAGRETWTKSKDFRHPFALLLQLQKQVGLLGCVEKTRGLKHRRGERLGSTAWMRTAREGSRPAALQHRCWRDGPSRTPLPGQGPRSLPAPLFGVSRCRQPWAPLLALENWLVLLDTWPCSWLSLQGRSAFHWRTLFYRFIYLFTKFIWPPISWKVSLGGVKQIDHLRVETKKWKVGKLQFSCRNFCSSRKPCLRVCCSVLGGRWWRNGVTLLSEADRVWSNLPPFSRLLFPAWISSFQTIHPPSGYLKSCRWNLSWWSCDCVFSLNFSS